MSLSKKLLLNTFILIMIVELLSFLAFLIPVLHIPFFLLILLIVFMFSLKDLSYGVYIAIAELMIGSKGHLFSVEIFGFPFSIRLAIFLIVIFLFLWKRPKWYPWGKRFSCIRVSYFALAFFLLFGIAVGFLKGNPLSILFFDFNGYLYFAFLPVVLSVFTSWKSVMQLISVMIGAFLASIMKISIVAYIFSHGFIDLAQLVYRWIRVTGVGEITDMGFGLYRIFLQSQVYHLILFFFLLSFLLTMQNTKLKTNTFIVLVLANASLILSLSRSFWLALLVTGILWLVFEWAVIKRKLRDITKMLSISFVSVICSFLFILGILYFPFPQSQLSGDSLSLLSKRADLLSEDAAISSRWKLLPVLMSEIQNHWFIGAGFGKTVTYQTLDPRALEQTQGKPYTTYAFEWGYLDFWLKMGIFGLLCYLSVLISLGYALGKKAIETQSPLFIGAFFSLIALSVTHFFSPYLNHPLGISILILLTALVFIDKKPPEIIGLHK